ncbi:MAG: CD225/dispanin family protein [Actinobacteria bacterium]|nr:CD225/dispanin family protein [Actinomycetota bacterium]
MNGDSTPEQPQDPGGQGREPWPGSGSEPSWPPPPQPEAGGYTFPQGPQPGYRPPPASGPPYGGQPYGQPYGGQPYGQPYGAPGYGTPGGGYGMPAGQQPPSYLAWGILAAVGGVLFCLIGGVPTAIVAIVNANKVKTKWSVGDQAGAQQASRTARTWAIVSTVLDAIGVIIVVIIIASGLRAGGGNP